MKRYWHSKTLWVNTIALIGAILARYTGITLSGDETAALLAVINIILRKATDTGLF